MTWLNLVNVVVVIGINDIRDEEIFYNDNIIFKISTLFLVSLAQLV